MGTDNMHDFQLIEDETIKALAPLKAEGLKTLAAYSGELDVDQDELVKMTGRFPCIYVAAGGLSSETENRTDTLECSVVLVIGDKNPRGAESAARGDFASPGVYSLLEKVKEKLHQQRIVPGWMPLILQREYPVFYKPASGVCLYMAVYSTRCRR